jgi:hypothetical protein
MAPVSGIAAKAGSSPKKGKATAELQALLTNALLLEPDKAEELASSMLARMKRRVVMVKSFLRVKAKREKNRYVN